jgi:hypothetical protein
MALGTMALFVGVHGAFTNFTLDPVPLARLPVAWLGLGEEFDGYLDGVSEGKWDDPVFRRVASALAPWTLRVGGTSADRAEYVGFRRLGYRPPNWEPRAFTEAHFEKLGAFAEATGARVIFDLNELHGRACRYLQQGELQRCMSPHPGGC